MSSKLKPLRKWIEQELIMLWDDMYHAYLFAYRPNTWSIAAEGFGERIKEATALVGPVSWRNIGMDALTSGWYAEANKKLGIDNPDWPSLDELIQCCQYVQGQREQAETWVNNR